MSRELSEDHDRDFLELIKFLRHKREEVAREVTLAYEDVRDQRLIHDDYTQEDVQDVAARLLDVVKGTLTSELQHFAHVNGLVVRELLRQSEAQGGASLRIDTGILEHKDLLEQISHYEDILLQGDAARAAFASHTLPSFSGGAVRRGANGAGGVPAGADAVAECQRLTAANEALERRAADLERQLDAASLDVAAKRTALREVEATVGQAAARSELEHLSAENLRDEVARRDADIRGLRARVATLEGLADGARHAGSPYKDEAEELRRRAGKLESEASTLQSDLDEAQRVLDAKVSGSVQFQNLKQMLQRKTEQFKELRTLAKRYVPEEELEALVQNKS
jgi:hypothetical protein